MKPILDGSLHRSGYGAPELRQYYQKSMSRSLVLSIVLQIACVESYYVVRAPEGQIQLPRIAEIIPYRSLTPPSLFQSNNTFYISTGTKSLVSRTHSILIAHLLWKQQCNGFSHRRSCSTVQSRCGHPSPSSSSFAVNETVVGFFGVRIATA